MADSPPLPLTTLSLSDGGVLNINVGILGHVDSGKTSLVRALSTQLSTASLDKSPQSRARGMTMDLGFSSFEVPMPAHLAASSSATRLQFTLVDCPGHAGLIKTIIGGAQIIDMMVLVIDVNKGIQTQTAECLVIGEITTDNMIVALNKCDLLPADPAAHAEAFAAATKRVRAALASTRFANAPFVPVAGAVGAAGFDTPEFLSQGLPELCAALLESTRIPERSPSGSLLYAVDHCFAVKGQGTVLTGTVLQGKLSVGQIVEVPQLRISKKVKSIQMFRKPVQFAIQGDRAGICVPGLDASLVERGIVAEPGTVPTVTAAIALVRKVRFFRGKVETNSKCHVTIGHTTCMAKLVFFGASEEMARRRLRAAEGGGPATVDEGRCPSRRTPSPPSSSASC